MQFSIVPSATPPTLGTVTREVHRGQRAGWLRAAVLGADDGIVSISSVAIGVIASGASTNIVLTAAVAALAAGAMSMAAGEYVSVSSQRDTERADLDQERRELREHPDRERQELAGIYTNRGLPPDLAGQVAETLMSADALGLMRGTSLASTNTRWHDLSKQRSTQPGALRQVRSSRLPPFSWSRRQRGWLG